MICKEKKTITAEIFKKKIIINLNYRIGIKNNKWCECVVVVDGDDDKHGNYHKFSKF